MAKEQIDILAEFIMANIDGEPSQSEGAGDTAIRIIKQLQAELDKAKNGIIEHRETESILIPQELYDKLYEAYRWIPVSERLPDQHNCFGSKVVFIVNEATGNVGMATYSHKRKLWDGPVNLPYPTHWKPIILLEGE